MPRTVACIAVAGLVLVQAGCQKPAAQAVPPPPLVGVFTSLRKNVPVLATANGTTRALEEVAIRARVRGFLTERHFEEGAYVKQGDLLFVIDEVPYKIALSSAKARLAEAEASLRKAEQSKVREVTESQLALDLAQLGLASIEERRTRALVARNAGSREDLDKAEAERKKSEAQVETDRAAAEQAKADYEVGILAAKAQVQAAESAVRDAEINLGYCRMIAPIDGRIGEAKVKLGNLVGPEAGGGGQYSELASIQQLDPMGVDIRASSRVLERATRLIREGLPIRLTFPGLDGIREYPHEGECYFIDNTIDPTTSTFLIKARVPNPERSLLPGEYVNVEAVVDKMDNVIVVPETAVMETDAGPVVYVIDREEKVAIQRVVAAQSYQGMRIITQGLDEGVPVIVEGLQMIRPGIPVRSEPVVLARPAGAAASAAETKPAEKPSGEAGQEAEGRPGEAATEPEAGEVPTAAPARAATSDGAGAADAPQS